MAEPKKGLDVIIGLGGGKPPSADKPDEGESDSDLPMDYVASFKDYQDNPSPQTFWEAVKSCMSAGEDMKKAGKPGGY